MNISGKIYQKIAFCNAPTVITLLAPKEGDKHPEPKARKENRIIRV